MKYILLIVVLCGSGCSSLKDVSPLEYSWQAMHLIDIAQTYHGVGSNPNCFDEGGTFAHALIGSHPNKEEVIGWGILTSVLHYGLGLFVDKTFDGKHDKFSTFLRTLDNGHKLKVINTNHKKGIRVNGLNETADIKCGNRSATSVDVQLIRF